MISWLMFWVLQAFLTCKDVLLFNPCLMCDRLVFIYVCFAYVNMLYASVWSETVHFCIRPFLLSKTLFMLVYSQYYYN